VDSAVEPIPSSSAGAVTRAVTTFRSLRCRREGLILLGGVRPALPAEPHTHCLRAEVVRTERHRGKLQQAPVDASLVVSAVNAPPLPIDDIRPLTGVAQRRSCRRERAILRQRERALSVDRQTLTAAAATAMGPIGLEPTTWWAIEKSPLFAHWVSGRTALVSDTATQGQAARVTPSQRAYTAVEGLGLLIRGAGALKKAAHNYIKVMGAGRLGPWLGQCSGMTHEEVGLDRPEQR
jgi:hypothetical protein